MKILIIQSAKLGDMVCTTPVFRAIKKHIPHARVVVAGNKINKTLLEHNIDVDEYVVVDNHIRTVFYAIKHANPDIIICTNPFVEGLIASLAFPFKKKIFPIVTNGYCPYQTRLYRLLVRFVTTVPHRMGQYAPQEYLNLLQPLGIISSDTTKYVTCSAESLVTIHALFSKWGIVSTDCVVGISPSAGNKIKKWPPTHFAKVCDYIYEKYNAKIIIIGTEQDRTEVQELVKNVKQQTVVYNASELLSLDELKACISKMNMFISVDTGPIYIAEAYVVPTVDIIGPIDEKEQPPISNIHRVVVPLERKKPELHVMNARVYDKKEALRQTQSITVEQVIKEIDELFTL